MQEFNGIYLNGIESILVKNKIGIIVPFRKREEHLSIFLPKIESHLKKQKIDYEIFVVEQTDDKPFNRGALLNIGVDRAIKHDCNYVALHDVDMIPTKDVDYSYVDRPTHLATNFISKEGEKRVIFDTYFGGVTLFSIFDYLKVNGYSNNYWGWGYEDDDLLFRCKENFMDINVKQIPTKTRNTAGLRFNGYDSEVKLPMPFGLNDFTMLLSCKPDEIKCDSDRDIDEYSIVAIPGFDTGFSFNSFKRFKFETFDRKKEVISLKSNIQSPKNTVLVATVDNYNKLVRFYQDGELVDEEPFEGRLMHYHGEDYIIIGQTGNEYNKRRPFSGIIDYFAFYNHCLEPGQVKSVSENLHLGLTEQFENYTNPHNLEMCYDFKIGTNQKLFDLSKRRLEGEVYHCDRVSQNQIYDYEELPVPWRRESTFELLWHPDNGFYENKWTYTETRKNQVRFFNKVLKGLTNWKKDGIDKTEYHLMNEIKKKKVNYIYVEL